MKRHTCIICNKKRYEHKMTRVLVSSWACKVNNYPFASCCNNKEILEAEKILIILKTFKHINLKHFS